VVDAHASGAALLSRTCWEFMSQVGVLWQHPPPPIYKTFPPAAFCRRLSGCQIDCLSAEFNFHSSRWCKLIAYAEGPVGWADPLTSAVPGILSAAWGAVTARAPHLLRASAAGHRTLRRWRKVKSSPLPQQWAQNQAEELPILSTTSRC